MMIHAQVIVRPRASIFDPQGDAVRRAIHHLGLKEVTQVHVGKAIELELEAPTIAAARTQLEVICRDLLSNPVIEDYVLYFPGQVERKSPVKSVKPVLKKKPTIKPLKKTIVKKAIKRHLKKAAIKKAKKKK